MGGLGNYLFQISTSHAISKRTGKKMLFDISDIYSPHKTYNHYLDNFFRKVEFTTITETYNTVFERGFEFANIPEIDGNLKLNGYFQSEKYFIDNRKDILNLFEIDTINNNYLSEKYLNVLTTNTCSIHVRRGDYLHLTDIHPTQDLSYYIDSYNTIGEDYNYLIFSDDISWCLKNFGFIKHKTFITGNTDFQDLYLMSMCDNNIIANSTFSWWGAWLNENNDKRVIIPKKWFGDRNSHLNTNDLYPNKWIKI